MDVIKLRILRLGPKCNHMYPYMRKVMEDLTYIGGRDVEIEQREISR